MAGRVKKRVLMIDDSVDDYVLVRDMLDDIEPGKYEINWAQSAPRGLSMASSAAYDAVLLDYRIGAYDGLKFLEEAKESGIGIPIIVLTGQGNGIIDVESMRKGAADYLVKEEMTPAMVDRAIRHAIERERILKALVASEEKFRSVFEDSAMGIALTDSTGNIYDTNPCFQEMFGPTEKLRGRALTSLIHPEEAGQMVRLLGEFRGGKTFCARTELRYVAGGRTVWGKTLVSSITRGNLDSPHLAVMILDETEAKLLEERKRMACLVVDNTSDGVMVTDSHGVISSVNPGFTKITEYTAAEAVGKKSSMLKSDRHDEEFYKRLWKSLKSGGVWSGEIWNRRKGGSVYPQAMSIRAVKDDSNRIVHYVSIFRDISDAKRQEEEIRHRAYHDPLTGLPNRILFGDRLNHAILHAKRLKTKVALIFFDLDGFKLVNDTYGHLAGDMLLQGVAIRLTALLREEDTLSRLSGDEFTVILEDVGTMESVKIVAEKILEAVREEFIVKNGSVRVSASLGVALYPEDSDNPHDIVQKADEAMYIAKANGKDRIAFYSSGIAR
ncbi:MAG: diguanylate cyclase [Nitrospinae bacterium]|nr:diguanylate cyclase [Nitrospinota bacterium]